jgi:hypothetical protein
MRSQYQINHRTRNTWFDRQEIIACLGTNRVSTWSNNRGEETRPKAKAKTTDVTQSFCIEHKETDIWRSNWEVFSWELRMSRSPFAESTRKQTSEDQEERFVEKSRMSRVPLWAPVSGVNRVEGTSYGSQESFCEHPFPVFARQKTRSYECQESLCEHPFLVLTG